MLHNCRGYCAPDKYLSYMHSAVRINAFGAIKYSLYLLTWVSIYGKYHDNTCSIFKKTRYLEFKYLLSTDKIIIIILLNVVRCQSRQDSKTIDGSTITGMTDTVVDRKTKITSIFFYVYYYKLLYQVSGCFFFRHQTYWVWLDYGLDKTSTSAPYLQ